MTDQLKFDLFAKPAVSGLQLKVRLAEVGGGAASLWRVSKQIATVAVADLEAAKLEFGAAPPLASGMQAEGYERVAFCAYVVGVDEPQCVATFERWVDPRESKPSASNLQDALTDAFEAAVFDALRNQANAAVRQDDITSPRGQAQGGIGSGDSLGTKIHVA
uniref:hypothetical protein n=1 Tax=Ralstonia sp. ASV6 TaxID=2795124 RepID=UPI0018EB7052